MVLIPAGTFEMGCAEAFAETYICEYNLSTHLPHLVTFSRSFWLDQTEVTQADFESLMGYDPSFFFDAVDSNPVENLTWHQAAAFANAKSNLEERTPCYTCEGSESELICEAPEDPYGCEGYRLPTEAEWEYAARANADYWYAGSDNYWEVAWTLEDGFFTPQPVATRAPNGWHLYDMSGNVYEWTHDWWDPYYYEFSPNTDPVCNEPGMSYAQRTRRSGSYDLVNLYSYVLDRSFKGPETHTTHTGFRLARTASGDR
jgi:formylglycine-generating enzyme required for sulfatase activity